MNTASDEWGEESAEAEVLSRYEGSNGWADVGGNRRATDRRRVYVQTKGARAKLLLSKLGFWSDEALEIGVGGGEMASLFASGGTRIVGIDISQSALDRAAKLCEGLPVELRLESGLRLSFENETFSLAYAFQVFHLYQPEDRVKMLREVRRILQPGGVLLFDVLNRWSHAFKFARMENERRYNRFPRHSSVVRCIRESGLELVGIYPGMLPKLRMIRVPALGGLSKRITHTAFFVVRRPR